MVVQRFLPDPVEEELEMVGLVSWQLEESYFVMAALVVVASVNIHDLVEADQVEVLEEALRPWVHPGVVQVGLASYDQPPVVHQLKPFDLISLTLRTVYFALTNNFSVC